jgi:hypothetical protein
MTVRQRICRRSSLAAQHSSGTNGITTYLNAGGTSKTRRLWPRMQARAPRSDDRTGGNITLDEVETIEL